MNKTLLGILATAACGMMATSASALTITPTTDGPTLASALAGSGVTITNVTTTNGTPSQFGTYTDFTSPPVTIGNGVVLSTGQVIQTPAAFHSSSSSPSTTRVRLARPNLTPMALVTSPTSVPQTTLRH